MWKSVVVLWGSRITPKHRCAPPVLFHDFFRTVLRNFCFIIVFQRELLLHIRTLQMIELIEQEFNLLRRSQVTGQSNEKLQAFKMREKIVNLNSIL